MSIVPGEQREPALTDGQSTLLCETSGDNKDMQDHTPAHMGVIVFPF
jgi:hypothetical protein